MIRAAPDVKCQRMEKSQGEGERILFDWIDKKCIIWDKAYLVLLDAAAMVKVEDTTRPVCGYKRGTKKPIPMDLWRTVQPWIIIRQQVLRKLRDIDLAKKIDEIIRNIPKALPPLEEYQRYTTVVNELKKLRKQYGGPKKRKRWWTFFGKLVQ